jgi:hypothetical protein
MESGAPEGLSFRAPAMGWEMRAASLFTAVTEAWQRFGLPIMVTEAGTADGHDAHRPAFIARQMYGLANAAAAGVPVLGYMHWTLFDSWEWCEGYAARFGLFATDFERLRAARAQGLDASWMRSHCFVPRGAAHDFRRIAHSARGITPATGLVPEWDESAALQELGTARNAEQQQFAQAGGWAATSAGGGKGPAGKLAGGGRGGGADAHERPAGGQRAEPAKQRLDTPEPAGAVA